MTLMQLTELVISWGFSRELFGVQVYISYWTLLLAIILIVDARTYIRRQEMQVLRHTLRSGSVALTLGSVIGGTLMILSVAAHEYGHAWVATLFGYHITGAGISWWGAYVTLPEAYSQGTAWATVMVSFAGPTTNILIAGFGLLFVWGLPESLPENIVQFVAYMNWRLGKLNFLPIILLDGGHMVLGVSRLVFGNTTFAATVAHTISFGTIYYLLRIRKSSRRKMFEPSDRFEQILEEV